MDYIVVFITVPEYEIGKNLADILLKEKLADCINITEKINSIYFWQGNIENNNEYLLIIKTRKDKFEQLSKEVKENHPYLVPEIIAVPIIRGSEDYLNWVDNTLNRN